MPGGSWRSLSRPGSCRSRGRVYIPPPPIHSFTGPGSDPSRKDETTNARTYIIAAVLLIALVALPVMACETPPTCPPGEVWGQTGQHCYQVPAVYGSCQNCPSHTERQCEQMPFWQANDFRNLGDCVSHYVHSHHKTQNEAEQTCKATVEGNCHDVTVYDCHSEGYISCDGAHHEKRIITPAHEQCDPIFGCIAVSCPAVPCGEGQHCNDGQCVTDTCPDDFQCGEGQVCIDGGCQGCPEGQHVFENECVPDQCGVDFQCDEGYQCDDQNQCIPIPPRMSGGAVPFTEPACIDILNTQRPMDDIDPKTLPLLDLKDTFISASFHYISEPDCVAIAYYSRGEASYNAHCTAVEYYNREQQKVLGYGGIRTLTAYNPAEAFCVLHVKNSPTETTLPVTITITDSKGTSVPSIVSSDPVIWECYRLPEDWSGCRLRDVYMPYMAWMT